MTLTASSGPQPSASCTGNNNRMDGSSYDASGDLQNDGARSYAYDAEHRLTSVDSGNTAKYTYKISKLPPLELLDFGEQGAGGDG